jgi:serine/threonine protein kinase
MTTMCINHIDMTIFGGDGGGGGGVKEYIGNTFFPLQSLIQIRKGDFLGPYQLIRRIDGGTYGDVWEAIDTRPHSPLPPPQPRKVAIKIQCNTDESDDEHYFSAFRELECLHRLSGIENVVQLLDAFYVNSTLFFVLEYCEHTLHQLFITIKHTSNKEQILRLIFKQILQGLVAINSKGYIHLDIKPKNILIDSTGTVKICDFSISQKSSEITQGEEYCSTWWRPPEVVNNHLHGKYFKSTFNIGFNADIWAIGCILYEGMSNGEILYCHDDSEKLLEAFKKKHFYKRDNHYINTKLSKYPILVDFIKLCLIHDNTERPIAEQLLTHDFFK